MRAKHAFRIASLVVPSWLAWYIACTAPHRGELTRVVSWALGPLWIALAGALVLRAIVVVVSRRRDASRPTPVLASIDVLTSSGTALAWSSALGIVLAIWLGYASLAVVGLLGTGLFHAVALHAFVALRGSDPIRTSTITRTLATETLTEGDDAVERIHVRGARIPMGYRLFFEGRIGRRWAHTRHVMEATESGAEVVLESDLGPAVRGEHDAEPLAVWLEDAFGLCRSRRFDVGAMHVSVVPKVREVDRAVPLLDRGQGPNPARATRRLPTEGLFDLREYQPGDDVRRIHWVRSLAAGQLIVRLPDEIPPDRPRVRVVIDTFFPEAFVLDCDAPAEILDSLVGVWLAVARSLAESGARVTLVAAIPQEEGVKTLSHEMMLRAPHLAQRIGARIAWQNRMPVESMLTDEATFVVSRGLLAEPPSNPQIRWIVVAPPVTPDLAWPFKETVRLPHPMGSSDNRWTKRKRVVERFVRERNDHGRTMVALGNRVFAPPAGSLAACGLVDGRIRLEALR